jgi:hypothetical protein
MNLYTRLDKLERLDGGAAGRMVLMWQHAGEDDAATYARWCGEHPDRPAPDLDDRNVLIVRWAHACDADFAT